MREFEAIIGVDISGIANVLSLPEDIYEEFGFSGASVEDNNIKFAIEDPGIYLVKLASQDEDVDEASFGVVSCVRLDLPVVKVVEPVT